MSETPTEFKKISFITRTSFLALGKDRRIYVGWLEDGSLKFAPQRFSHDQEREILDFALDVQCPWHVALLQKHTKRNPDSIEKHLYIADLKKCKDGKISYAHLIALQNHFEHANLWFTNGTIGVHSKSNNTFSNYLSLVKTIILSRKEMIEKFTDILTQREQG